jgi:hypothetical protein
MDKAEKFLDKYCLQINKRHWTGNEKKLYQIGAKTLQQYADEQSREKCNSCMFTYHNKANKGFHDVEEFYQEGE